ncbi:BrnA antitoxin family protein [Candidatus Methylopumilus turicensis]|uniref:BrnA antitoxin family protein n=1 Tax=Candidatus Methylopumilus turicensis TaxID=1581680 RepID=A0A0B7J1F2_9PROT|nr:BrnA antitoxin family protein [Candidatus Methylopumilus turicensis]CEN56479.1 conserved protein of unknown function [Candidatus Methylopumilus turicensis]
MSKKLIRPTDEEDLLITAAASNDADNVPLTDDEWNRVRATVKRGPGRPMGSGTKAQVTLRLDVEVIEALRATGTGWQTRANDILRKGVHR